MEELPRVKSNIGDKGVKILRDIIEDEIGWLFIEQPLNKDYGIDAHMEIVKDGQVTGKLIAIQIKAGKSYFKEINEEGFVFRGDIKHYNYWISYSLPVILVLCDIEDRKCYWVHINEDNVIKVSDTTWKVIVPKNQILSRDSVYELKKIAENRTEYERRLDKLIVHKPLMEEIIKGNKVILESEEWVNKTSGRGSIKIKIIDKLSGKEEIKIDWPYILLPFWNYKDVFEKIFPWADISVDEEFYDDYDTEQFLLEYAFYDDEEDKWIYDYEDLENYKRQLPKIRPYIIEYGEVARYRLILKLNDLGKAFLIIDKYLRKEC